MPPERKPWPLVHGLHVAGARYVLAVAAVVAVTALKVGLARAGIDQAPYTLLAVAIMLAAWMGGLGPGIVASVLGMLVGVYLFEPPRGTLAIGADGWARALVWLSQGLFLTAVLALFRRAIDRRDRTAQRVRLLVNSVPALMAYVDSDLRYRLANQEYRRWLGLRPEDIRGRRVPEVIGEENWSAVRPFLERALAGEAVTFERGLARPEGGARWVSVAYTPDRGEDGRVRGVAVLVSDITELERARAALQHREEALRERVAAQTEELRESHERLRLSERLAALGTLSAGIGHDMGNLLLPIRARLDSLSKEPLSDGAAEDVAAIRKAADYLRALASGLRLLAQDPDAEGGGVPDLAAWCEESERMWRTVLPRAVELECRVPAGLPGVAASAPALMQAVFNLVQNAGEAMADRPSGTVRVSAERGPEKGAAGTVRVIVSDDGPGMTEEVRRRCMEPFFTTKTRRISTGLGLALVHGIVQKAGGAMEIESAPGCGATFVLTLPALPGGAPGAGAGALPIAAVSVADARLRGFVSALLGGLGFRVKLSSAPGAPVDGEARLWLADVAAADEASMAQFIARGPGRRVVLFGAAPSEGAQAGRPQVTSIAPGVDPAAIRRALRSVVRESGAC